MGSDMSGSGAAPKGTQHDTWQYQKWWHTKSVACNFCICCGPVSLYTLPLT